VQNSPTPDGPNYPAERCASCNGMATTLYVSGTYGLPPKPLLTCQDRTMCRDIMILENLISKVRSA
jgi:hypothetical protein